MAPPFTDIDGSCEWISGASVSFKLGFPQPARSQVGTSFIHVWPYRLRALTDRPIDRSPSCQPVEGRWSSSGELVPIISVLHLKDEIGDLNRVMREMSRQVQEHFDQVVKSEMSLRTLNQELSAPESRYRGMVDHAPIGIFTTKGMQVTFSNRHNQILAGLDPDEQVDPASFRARIHPEDLDRVLSDFSRSVAASRQCELIFRFVHADGGVLTILSRRVPISDFDSPDPIYVGFNIDITALHELQLRLSRTEKLATLGQMMDRIVNQIVEYARTRDFAVQLTLSDLVNEALKLLNGPLEG